MQQQKKQFEQVILRPAHACQYLGISRTDLHHLHEKDPSFPRKIRFGGRAVGWRKESLDTWLEQKETTDREGTHSENSAACGEKPSLDDLFGAFCEARNTIEDIKSLLTKFMDDLTERERAVVERRFGLVERLSGAGETLGVIGEEMGCERELIRQIEAKALRKMRNNRKIGWKIYSEKAREILSNCNHNRRVSGTTNGENQNDN